MRDLNALLAAAALLLPLAACTPTEEPLAVDPIQDTPVGFDVFDDDGDDSVDAAELGAGVESGGLFGELDDDGDGFLDDGEFAGVGGQQDFGLFDTDDDNRVSLEEYRDGLLRAADGDADGAIDQAEWERAEERGLFDA